MPISNESKEALKEKIAWLNDKRNEKQIQLDIKTIEKQTLKNEIERIETQINKLREDVGE